MKRIPIGLQVALAFVTIVGVALGLLLDAAAGNWVGAHPVTAGIISGTLTVPLTLLLAIYLVDYFVEREEKRRLEPLRVYWLQEIRKHVRLALEFGARSAWDPDFNGGLATAHAAIRRAWDCDPRTMYDWRDENPLPPGWAKYPLTPVQFETVQPRLRHSARVAREAREVVSLVHKYAERFSDPGCWLWRDLVEDDLQHMEQAEAAEGKDYPPHLLFGVSEYLCALLVHLGLIAEDEWSPDAGPRPQQAIPVLDRPSLRPPFRTAVG